MHPNSIIMPLDSLAGSESIRIERRAAGLHPGSIGSLELLGVFRRRRPKRKFTIP